MRTDRTNTAWLAGLLAMSALASPALAVMHPTLGRWTQRDPAGYADGMNLPAEYQAVQQAFDPSGTCKVDPLDGVTIQLGLNLADLEGRLKGNACTTLFNKDITALSTDYSGSGGRGRDAA